MSSKFSPNKDVYFASIPQGDPHLLDELLEKINIYRNYCQTSGKLSRWQRSLQNYFGISSDGTKASNVVTRGGDSGQLTMAKVNDYRNLIQNQLILVTSQRPAGEAKAINSDPDSLKQARIGSMLTEYYLSQVGWEQRFIRQQELALVVDEGFFVLDWDANLGSPIRPIMDEQTGQPTGKMITTGDLVSRIVAPWNMARDPYVGSPEDMKWGIYSYRVNKFDLISKFPQYEDDILKGNSKKLKELVFNTIDADKTDQTEIFVLSHDKTSAVPDGRLTMFTSEAVLLDGPLPYDEFNIYRNAQNDGVDSSFGYSNNNDLLALEEVTDALHSIIISNNTTFGAQSIIAPKGANLDHTQLAKGFAYFEVEPAYVDKVLPLNLVRTSKETFEYLETLSRKKETLAGINSVVRGDPEGALRSSSGSAMALVQAQSIQYQSGSQRGFYQNLSKVMTGAICILRRYSNSEKVIRITGKNNKDALQSFKYTGSDLTNVSTIQFEMTNPLEKTLGGKETLAKDLLQSQLIKNARQYITLARTGSLDAFVEDDEADELAIKEENEWLRDGKPVLGLITENHEEHIQGHMSIIASPTAKQDQTLVQATLSHIQWHAQTWQMLSQTNPALLIATKQKVLPPPPPPPGMMPGGPMPGGPDHNGPSGGPPAPVGTGGSHPGPLMNPPGDHHGIAPPKLPRPPINPATHQPAPMPPGANVS